MNNHWLRRCLVACIFGLAATALVGGEASAKGKGKAAPREWPDVLVIDNFESGIGQWANEDSGRLELGHDAPGGKPELVWTSADDSVGKIALKALDREKIDFSQYSLLQLKLKVSGRMIWNFGPILQQYPAAYGFPAMYYSVDTLHPFDKWYTYVQDLGRWENVEATWGDAPKAEGADPAYPPAPIFTGNFSTQKQAFRLEVQQLAGSGQTKIEVAEIKLLKNPLGLQPSYAGKWAKLPDGRQATSFQVALKNKKDKPLTVKLDMDAENPGSLKEFKIELPLEAIILQPGEEKTAAVSMVVDAGALKRLQPWYGETARLAVSVAEVPGLTLYTELVAGSKPETVEHPMIFCDAKRMRQLQEEYANPEARAKMSKELLKVVADGEAALAYVPEYPPLAADAAGYNTDPVTGGKLQRVEVPNLPFDIYQDPISGRTYSGQFYDSAMKGWTQKHIVNSGKAKALALAYLVTGRKEFAQAAAKIILPYCEKYLALPMAAFKFGSPAGSACSGSVRIGGTFMRERVWLGNMAQALDAIIPAEVLSREEIDAIGSQVFEPSASNMMDHQIGVMNLQVMVDSAAFYAGLASEHPGVVARSMYDSHGIDRVFAIGFLADGNWWENPSYQNVLKLCAYPTLVVGMRAGIFKWDEQWKKRVMSAYQMDIPGQTSVELGTGGARTTALEDTLARVLAPIIPDPNLAWIFYNHKPAPWAEDIYSMASLCGGAPLVPQDKAENPYATKTVDFADYGGLAMRVEGGDAYAYLQYGREVTHGHFNKLSLHAFGKGGWYMRNLMGGYTDHFKEFLEPVSSACTIMVDGKNANRDTGTLLCQKSQPGVEIASARENAAWQDVEHERTVVLTKGPLIIIDRCLSEVEHSYDWLYYAEKVCNLSPVPQQLAADSPKSFGDTPAFTVLLPDGKYAAVGSSEWKREDGSGVKMAFMPAGEMYQTKVEGERRPNHKGFGDNQGLLWRQKAKNCFFVTAMWPYAAKEGGELEIKQLPAAGQFDTAAVVVKSPEGECRVTVNYKASGAERVVVESSQGK